MGGSQEKNINADSFYKNFATAVNPWPKDGVLVFSKYKTFSSNAKKTKI